MAKGKYLTWNPLQVQIWELLESGMGKAAIAKQLGTSITAVTKVANAIAKGQSPSNPAIQPPPPPKAPKKQKLSSGPAAQPKDVINPPPPAGSKPPPKVDSSLLLLKPIPTNCALTPIMLNARYTAIKEFKWPETMTWEDFFDTCLVWLFRYWGWGLQGAYRLEDSDNGQAPKPASEKAEGDGQADKEYLEKATKLGLVLLDIMGQGTQAGVTPG